MNVLLTCVGRRKYLVDYFKCEELVNLVVGADMQNDAPAFHSCDVRELVPSIYSEDYIPALLKICEQHDIGMLVSLNDMEIPILSQKRSLFEKAGVNLIISNDSAIDICSDKWLTYKFAVDNGLKSPETFLCPKEVCIKLDEGSISYPLIVKPRWGSASFGLYIVDNEKELFSNFEQCKLNLRQSYLKDFCKSEQSVIIQEFISGQEIGVDIFNSLEGSYIASTQKKKLAMRSGETDKATTMNNPFLRELCKLVSSKLGHVANLDCDFFLYNGDFYLLEMNPRFGGGYPFSHEAGSNYVKTLLEICSDQPVTPSSYKSHLTFAKCDTLVPSIGN